MRFLVAVIVLASLLAACSSDKPQRLKAGDVTPEELRALVPVESVPGGFTQLPASSEPSPIPTPTGPYYQTIFRNSSGNTIAISVFPDSGASLGDPSKDLCRSWKAYTKSQDCPIKKEQVAQIGDKAAAYSSAPDQEGRIMHTTIFVRDGLRVGFGVLVGDSGSQLLSATTGMMKSLDQRIQQLSATKLGKD